MVINNLKIKKKTIAFFFALIVLNIPGFLIDINTIYHTEFAYANGDFAKLNYSFTFLELILCVVGFLVFRRKSNCINMYIILMLIFMKDIFRYFLGQTEPFYYNSYEMYLCILIGMSTCALITRYSESKEDVDKFIDWLLIINFIYQVLFILTGRIGAEGRVSSMSISYGAIGFTCALQINYILLTREKNISNLILIVIYLISMILSGSRFSLLITLAGIICFNGYIFKSIDKRKRIYIILTLVIVLSGLVFVLSSPKLQEQYDILNRMSNLFKSNQLIENVIEDESFIGRSKSIEIGIEIIKENILGISNSFIDIQGRAIDKGFFSFPHSYIICYYLLWGPIFIYCIFWLIKLIYNCFKKQEVGYALFLIFLMICLFIYGGVDTSSKVYTYIFIIISSINIGVKTKKCKEEKNKETN